MRHEGDEHAHNRRRTVSRSADDTNRACFTNHSPTLQERGTHHALDASPWNGRRAMQMLVCCIVAMNVSFPPSSTAKTCTVDTVSVLPGFRTVALARSMLPTVKCAVLLRDGVGEGRLENAFARDQAGDCRSDCRHHSLLAKTVAYLVVQCRIDGRRERAQASSRPPRRLAGQNRASSHKRSCCSPHRRPEASATRPGGKPLCAG